MVQLNYGGFRVNISREKIGYYCLKYSGGHYEQRAEYHQGMRSDSYR